MEWKITSLNVSHQADHALMASMHGSTYQPQNLETTVDISMVVRDLPSVGSIEEFEESLQNNFKTDSRTFTRDEVYVALREKYPEHFL